MVGPRRAASHLMLGALLLAAVLLLGVLPLVAVAAMFRTQTSSSDREVLVELPLDYRGWVVIRYLDPSCPPLGRLGHYDLLNIPPSGRFCTSSGRPRGGTTAYRYVYLSGDGSRSALDDRREPLIWGHGLVLGDPTADSALREAFFVGTEEEYDLSQRSTGLRQQWRLGSA